MQVEELIKEYLEQNIVLQLATVQDGKPQLCTVHYAYDEDLNFYWFSSRSSHHSVALAGESPVSLGVLHSVELRQCVHVNGLGHLASKDEMKKAHEVYSKRFGESPERLERALSDDQEMGSYYICKPNEFILFDAEHFPDSPRQELSVRQ